MTNCDTIIVYLLFMTKNLSSCFVCSIVLVIWQEKKYNKETELKDT